MTRNFPTLLVKKLYLQVFTSYGLWLSANYGCKSLIWRVQKSLVSFFKVLDDFVYSLVVKVSANQFVECVLLGKS